MAVSLTTTTQGLLSAYASAAMKDGAEEAIKKAVAEFEKTVRERVYDEVQKIAVHYAEMVTNSDPLRGRELHIVIDDRRENR